MFHQSFRFLLVCIFLVGPTGCALINSVSLTPIPAQRTNVVRAEVSKMIFLGFNFDNDFIDPLVTELKQKCPNGVVSGILTKDETISYLLLFKKRVVATGYCSVGVAKTARGMPGKRVPGSEDPTASENLENVE